MPERCTLFTQLERYNGLGAASPGLGDRVLSNTRFLPLSIIILIQSYFFDKPPLLKRHICHFFFFAVEPDLEALDHFVQNGWRLVGQVRQI